MEDEWKKSQTKPIEKQFFKAKATSILCNGKDWYCSVDTAVYKFQVNEVVENKSKTWKIQNIRKVVAFEKEVAQFWIDKLVIYDEILIVNALENKQPAVYFFDCTSQARSGFLQEISIPRKKWFDVSLAGQYDQVVLLIDDNKNNVGIIAAINAYEIAKQRQIKQICYGSSAIDINKEKNRVAFLRAYDTRFHTAEGFLDNDHFAPVIEYADFTPNNMTSIIDEFNKMVMRSQVSKQEAKTLVTNIINKYQELHPLSLWQRMYQKIKNNIKLIGITAVGVIGLSWLYSKRSNVQIPAAWGKIPQMTTQK
jgi:hypothetical protein